MRRFHLLRHVDVTGFSGIGMVAEGVEFIDGRAALRWCVPGKPRSTVEWDSVADVLEVSGHDGSTTLQWVDPDHLGTRR